MCLLNRSLANSLTWLQGSGGWKDEANVVSVESWKKIISGIAGNPVMIPQEEDSLFDLNEVNRSQFTIVFHLITQLVRRSGHVNPFLMGCLIFFPPVLLLDVSCQIHMDRHLHSLTNVDVGKDSDTCGHTSMFAHDLCPNGDYHTHTHTDKWTHIPGKVLKVWKHGLLVYVTF